MAFKPHRGTMTVDKRIQEAHESYFAFWEATNFFEKSKHAFKMLRAAKYLNDLPQTTKVLQEFIEQAKSGKFRVYKPLLKYIS